MLNFRIPNKQYNIKIIDSLSFLQGKQEDLSKDLDNDLKIVTKSILNINLNILVKN